MSSNGYSCDNHNNNMLMSVGFGVRCMWKLAEATGQLDHMSPVSSRLAHASSHGSWLPKAARVKKNPTA